MSTGPWRVLDNEQRPTWRLRPFQHVGPLEFGMTSEQTTAAVSGNLRAVTERWSAGRLEEIEFRPTAVGPFGTSVNAYFDEEIGLAGVAVNALFGPQVVLDGISLVARVPSELDDELTGYAIGHAMVVQYSQMANLVLPEFGLVLRAQRAGDVVLSRPVLVAEGWADRCWDTHEGFIPREEWQTFEW